jgi:hypothetical protein
MFFCTMTPKIFCKKGSPHRHRCFEVERVGARFDRGEQTAPPVYGEGLAVDGFGGVLGLTREIVEGEIAAVEFWQAVDRGDEPVAHADLDLHRNAFADVEFVLGYVQVHEGGAVGGEMHIGIRSAREEGRQAGRGASVGRR